MPGTATTIRIDGMSSGDRLLFDAASKSLSYDADGLGGVDAVKFATIDTLQGGLDHTGFLIL